MTNFGQFLDFATDSSHFASLCSISGRVLFRGNSRALALSGADTLRPPKSARSKSHRFRNPEWCGQHLPQHPREARRPTARDGARNKALARESHREPSAAETSHLNSNRARFGIDLSFKGLIRMIFPNCRKCEQTGVQWLNASQVGA